MLDRQLAVAASDDDRVLDICLDALEQRKCLPLSDLFVRKLKDDNPKTIRRAAMALGRFGYPETTPALIDALVTRHKQTVTSGGGGSVSPTFGSDGSAGLSAGSSAKTIVYDEKHEAALAALTGMHQGVNFGFDKAQWKAWWLQSKMPRDVALRRDDG